MVMMGPPPLLSGFSNLSSEQLEPLEQWFESCNGAQQAAVAVKLLGRADPKATHLIYSFLQQKLLVTSAIWRQEIAQANDPAFLNGLRSESRDVAVSQLLHYLPLLRPANAEGVRGYVHLLPSLLTSFLEEEPTNGQQQGSSHPHNSNTEIQQLLTYALIHPALSLENKKSLAELIRQLDENGTQEMTLSLLDANNQGGLDMFPPPSSDHPLSSSSGTSRHWDPWSSPNNCGLGGSGGGRPMPSSIGQRVRRSNSLTPPSNNAMAYPQDVWNNAPNDVGGSSGRVKPRSLSLSSPGEAAVNGLPHCPLSPQNSLASSGSGSGSDSIYSDDNHRPASFHIPGSGMKDVPSWLKGLRLHKYAHLFSLLTYEEMLALTEEQLELQGVTKGARHKIALSIQRLRDRPALLAQLEKEVVDTGNVHNALNELKTVLSTPIKPYRTGTPVGGERRSSEDQLYVLGNASSSLSPSPSLLTRDDTSGYSSLDGSMDNLAPRAPSSTAIEPPSIMKQVHPGPPSYPAVRAKSLTSADMPTVIVSAAPDIDSAEEGGSDTSGDDGLGGCIGESLSPTFRSSIFDGNDLELMEPSHLSQDDLPGLITRLLGKICTQLLVSTIPAEDNVTQFVTLLDRSLSHEAFTHRQRRRIASWKEQAHRIWSTLPSIGGRGMAQNATGQLSNNNKNNSAEPSSSSRCFARRWSNVAHYPGFYGTESNGGLGGAPSSFGGCHVQSGNAYSLFPPRQQRNSHPSPCPSPSHARPSSSFSGPTHNSYGQHTHLASGMRSALTPTPSLPLCSPQHSLQIGSHLSLQHRNSFCVSALSHQSPSPLYGVSGCYSSLSPSPDPFSSSSSFTHPHRSGGNSQFEDPSQTSESFIANRLGIQRARSAPMDNGTSANNSLFSPQERDSVADMDLNHRLESLCLSMTEHALEGANDS